MEKIVVDKDLCIGCGACAAFCPETFEIGDDLLAEVIDNKVTDEATEALENCPTDAIKIEDDEENE